MEEQYNDAERLKKQQEATQNANNVRAMADIASKTANPYAKAAGAAVKAADKITGGKSSEALGKTLNKSMKMAPGGRLAQKAMNKMNENGTSSRISSALSKKNSTASAAAQANMKSNAVAQGKEDSFLNKREVEDQTSDGGEVNLKATAKVLKIGLIAFAPVMVVVVFMCLIVAGSQTYLSVIGLGDADKVSSADAETQIRENGSKDLDKEIKDEALNVDDMFIEDSIYSVKLNKLNFISNERPYNEADLKELEDFYSGINGYEGYDMDTVYKFFFKLLYIHKHYQKSYSVDLDMALIMSTLSVQSEDKSKVFIENTKEYKVISKEENEDFKYTRVWSDYTSTKTNSAHDIELLAKNMVTKTSDSGCSGTVDGGCYKIDEEKYRNFLRVFLKGKYYTEKGYTETASNVSNGICPTQTTFNKYVLTDDQLTLLAAIAAREQGSAKGAAAEASLMANLFESRGKKYGTGGEGLYNYVINGGWFGSAERNLNTSTSKATEEIKKAVKSVLVEGKRTLPKYIDEHDCILCTANGGDILSITIDGDSFSVTDKSKYVQHKTIIDNAYESTYTFYSFPTPSSDPFGYTSQENREKYGDFHYDFDTGEPVNCSIDPGKDGNYTSQIIYGDGEFINIRYFNQQDYEDFYYSKDPYKKIQFGSKKSPATIKSHGCGPTSLAIILSSFLNKDINPIETTSKVCLSGGCDSSGTIAGHLVTVAKEYGLKASTTSKDQEVIDALKTKNSLVIVLMGPGVFTSGGHYIVLTGVNSKGQVSVADPNSRERTNTKWYSFNTIVEQRKKYADYMIFTR